MPFGEAVGVGVGVAELQQAHWKKVQIVLPFGEEHWGEVVAELH